MGREGLARSVGGSSSSSSAPKATVEVTYGSCDGEGGGSTVGR